MAPDGVCQADLGNLYNADLGSLYNARLVKALSTRALRRLVEIDLGTRSLQEKKIYFIGL